MKVRIGILLVFVLTIAVFLINRIIKKTAHQKQAFAKAQSLPAVRLATLDSTTFQFSLATSIALLYFNSGCEHCQYELKELKKNLPSFAKAEVVLMSSENISTIKKASEDFGLANLPNIHFTKINANDVFDTFGSVSVPHIYIYGNDRKLVKEFRGETKIEAIIKYVQ